MAFVFEGYGSPHTAPRIACSRPPKNDDEGLAADFGKPLQSLHLPSLMEHASSANPSHIIPRQSQPSPASRVLSHHRNVGVEVAADFFAGPALTGFALVGIGSVQYPSLSL